MVSQPSYPLNSENARPPSTFASYLFLEVSAEPATTAMDTAKAAQPLNAQTYFSATCITSSFFYRVEEKFLQRLQRAVWNSSTKRMGFVFFHPDRDWSVSSQLTVSDRPYSADVSAADPAG